ncbi:MAG: hypothetical protein HC869_06280, partial [Rhodospirillales bacterium]|nr:hypothetical protein [Rhodospirillales bacterium]
DELAEGIPSAWIGRGQCIEHHGSGEPYLPVMEALARLARTDAHEQLGAVLRRIAPSWLLELPALLDSQERRVRYLRVSVTDRCNFRCTYCRPADDLEFGARTDLLTFEELERVVTVFARLGVRKLRLTGQIDRLVRVGKEILIVDYKTNRPPPHSVDDVAEAYTLQLAAYRLAVRQVFGTASVRAALLWTDGPRIMEIPAAVLDNAEKRVFTVDRASLDARGSDT